MKVSVLLCLGLFLLGSALVQADPLTASIQQTLKDQGFYYGEITGQKDADTTAAIRRYQIRNGLQITGELNAETQKSLGVQGKAPATPAPAISPPPVRPAPAPAPPENREDVPAGERAPVMEDDETIAPPTPPTVYPPGGGGSPNAGLFQG